MIQYKKILMTLALLLTAVTGAWAAVPELLVTIQSDDDPTFVSGSKTFDEKATVTFSAAVSNSVVDGWYSSNDISLTVTGANGYTVTSCKFYTAGGDARTGYTIEGESPVVYLYNINTYTGAKGSGTQIGEYGVTKIEVYGYLAEAPIVVEPGEAANTWTFSMPGSDVVLTPIYSAATISHAAGTPDASETPFETLKEAFAAVQDGDVITLDWNVTLTEALKTPSTASDISFTLDFNGFVIDNTGGTNYIVIDNGCELTLTDNSTAQTGGLKSQYPIAGSNGGKVIFQGGRYSFSGCSSQEIALAWDGLVSNYGWVMGDGKEFVDLNNGQPDDDGFTVRVAYKAIELTIGAGKFATFYSDQNTTLADGTDTNIGLYTIAGEGIDLDNNTVTATKVNDPIALAGMPLLVYNGTTEQKTVTLRVTPVAPTAGQMWSTYFKGTAVDKTFDADDMAKADYYVLSGGKAFAPVRGTGTISAHKCWLEFAKNNGSAPARQLTIVFDETTGVNEVIEVNEVSDDSWYDLNGRKIQKPARKGVYIKNGKKVVK